MSYLTSKDEGPYFDEGDFIEQDGRLVRRPKKTRSSHLSAKDEGPYFDENKFIEQDGRLVPIPKF